MTARLRACVSTGFLGLALATRALAGGQQAGAPPAFVAHAEASSERLLRREELARVDRERWETELYVEQIQPSLNALFAQLRQRSSWGSHAESVLHATFRGSPFSGAGAAHRERNGLVHIPWNPARHSALGRAEFFSDLARYAASFSEIRHTEVHVGRVEVLASATPRRMTLEADVLIEGLEGTATRQDQAVITIDYVQAGEPPTWLMSRLSLERMDTVLGPAQFTDVTSKLPADDEEAPENLFVAYFAEGVSVADFDGDGHLDLFQPRRRGPARLYRNDGTGRFTDVTRLAGLPDLPGVRSGYFFDWDNDGDLDLLLLTGRRLFMFENAHGRFADVSMRSGLDRLFTDGLTSAAVADYDRDGLLDVYVANYGDPAKGPGFGYFDSHNGFFNKLFHNEGNGSFADATWRSGLDADNRRWTYAALWIDYDDDGWPDLYVVNDYGPKQLFRNLGNGTFVDVADAAGASDPGNGMGAVWVDYDNDGRHDLYVSNMHSYSGSRITRAPGFGSNPEQRAIAQRFAKGNTLLRNTGAGRFVEVEPSPVTKAGWAWGSVAFDYDNDGDQDLYVANGMFSNAEEKDT